ncbi:MAG: undecaprenyldiphospho-muramoylpentapeptide beta-N-acetylglucosaminyltransferase [bacterium]
MQEPVQHRFLFAGGGTGGHLYPALAIAERLRAQNAEILFVGTKAGLEAKVIPQHGFTLKFLWLSGFRRGRILSNLLLPFKVLVSLWQSFRILRCFRPQAVLGTGGYTCGPVVLVAALFRIPIVLQEQNSFPGVTTRLLARFAKEVFLNFEEAAQHLPRRVAWQFADNPLRADLGQLDRNEALKYWKLNPDLPTLLVFGGSQGALRINRAIHDLLPQLGERCNLIWSRGEHDMVQPQGWKGAGVLIEKRFITEMPLAYAAADLAVCRSGAMTLSELKAAVLPAILIPFPFAAADHQRHNAEAFARRGAAVVVEDRSVNSETLLSTIVSLLSDNARLTAMRRTLQELPRRDGAALITEKLLQLAKNQCKK